MSYFKKFPKTIQDGFSVVDITRRVKIAGTGRDRYFDYAPYTVANGERPEDIAYYYYGSPNFVWLVLSVNNITDPYSQWVKDEENLNHFIRDKYRANYEAWKETKLLTMTENQILNEYDLRKDPILNWTQNTTITENILRYQSRVNSNIRMNALSYGTYGTDEFQPIRMYEHEVYENEKKRNIVLIDRQFLPEIEVLVSKALSNE